MADRLSQTPDSPVTWDTPEEEQLYWTRDEGHYPRPISPLTASLLPLTLGSGIEVAAAELRMGFQLKLKVINGWVYNAAAPMVPRQLIPLRLREHVARINQAVLDLPDRWASSYLPELERDIAALKAYDLREAEDGDLRDRLDKTVALNTRHWEIHMLTVFPVFAAGVALTEFYRRVMGPADESAPYRLLQGVENKTLEVDTALWQLVELARSSDSMSRLISESLDTANRPAVLPRRALSATEDGRRFQAAFDAFLEEYGYRATAADDLADVTWREDPSFVLETLRMALRGGARDPREVRGALVAEREEMIGAVRKRIGEDPGLRERFDGLLAAAQAVWPLRETHAFYIDQTSQALLRLALLEGGRRLARAGDLADASDVFYLTWPELRDGLVSREPSLGARAQERRVQTEAWARLQPPPGLGRVPPAGLALPPSEFRGTSERSGLRVSEDGLILQGVPGSAGRAVGPARVVLSAADFQRVQPGDVLVCPTTTPPWTPLFGVVAALVTDSGGVLSHGAIVAREYRLPAVVGTGVATREIRDGQRVEVDGTAGRVRLLP